MAATDPQSLLATAACYACYGGDPGMGQLLRLALLKQILLAVNPMAATDPQTLLSQANCYACYAGQAGTARLLELALLSQIAGGGGAGVGSGGVFSADYGGVKPTFNPGTAGAVAIDSKTGHQWQWFNSAWH